MMPSYDTAPPTRTEFRRDRLTWIAYVVLAWFAYLQAAPGLVIGHLRDELDLSYSTGGLHVAAFAAGSMVAGVISARLERALGRRALLWSAAALMGAGAIGLTAGRVAEATVGSVLVMGVGGGLLLATIQAALADHHGERRTVALAEANVAASIAYVALIGVLSLTAALHAGWRVALLASLAVPLFAWWSNRRLAIDAPPPIARGAGPPPRRVLDRGRDALLHDRGGVVRHRLGRDVRRGRRRRVDGHRGRADGRLLRRRAGRAHRSAAGWRAGTIRRGCSRSRSP